MRQAWLVLLVLLAACGGVGYNATGLWEGAATNPNGGISVRFNLKDENGNLSGSHSVYPTFRTPFTPAGNIARPPGGAPRSRDGAPG